MIFLIVALCHHGVYVIILIFSDLKSRSRDNSEVCSSITTQRAKVSLFFKKGQKDPYQQKKRIEIFLNPRKGMLMDEMSGSYIR